MQYKSGTSRNLREIAAQLGVSHMLEGSVQRAGNKVRVTAQLINARTDTHIWAERYDRDLADIFAIQSEIAKTIADQLRARLSPRETAAISAPPTTDLPAYDLYLRACQLYAESSVTSVHEKLPAGGAPARRRRGAGSEFPARLVPAGAGAWRPLLRRRRPHARPPRRRPPPPCSPRAVSSPTPGKPISPLADYLYHGFRDYDRARAQLDLARHTLPNSAEVYEYTGYIDRRQGRWADATRNLQRALDLDPRNFFTLQQMALTCQPLRRYADVARIYERALAIAPGDPGIRIYRAYLEIDARADVKPFQGMLAVLLAEDPRLAPNIDDPNFSLCERTSAAAARMFASFPREGSATMGANYPRAYWEGLVARWQGDAPRARAAFSAARAEVERVLSGQPDAAPTVSLLGMIDAGLGRKEEAIAEGRRASELLPYGKDALAGGVIAVNLAQILAWTGEKSAAIDQIAAVEQQPNLLSYGQLKLHPRWDDLRGDPRFETLVSSLAAAPPF